MQYEVVYKAAPTKPRAVYRINGNPFKYAYEATFKHLHDMRVIIYTSKIDNHNQVNDFSHL